MTRNTVATIVGARPSDGSSSSSSMGPDMRRAIASICCSRCWRACPRSRWARSASRKVVKDAVEILPVRASAPTPFPSRGSRARSSRGRCAGPPGTGRCPRRAPRGRSLRRSPRKRMRPARGCRSRRSSAPSCSSPAPLAPRRQTSSPRLTVSETPALRRAVRHRDVVKREQGSRPIREGCCICRARPPRSSGRSLCNDHPVAQLHLTSFMSCSTSSTLIRRARRSPMSPHELSAAFSPAAGVVVEETPAGRAEGHGQSE